MQLYPVLRWISQTLFFPQACVLCQKWVSNPDFSPLCQACVKSLKPLEEIGCICCGLPLPGNLSAQSQICSQCRSAPKPYDIARAFGAFQGELRSVIRKFKFEGYRRLAFPLAALLERCCGGLELGRKADWLLPVPLHPRRKRKRGFDQTLLLTRLLSRKLQIPVYQGLRRVRDTRPQSGLDIRERRENLGGAFELDGPEGLAGSDVVLVDDVMTTGTTVSEISGLLRRKGTVRKIAVLTVARVPLLYSDI